MHAVPPDAGADHLVDNGNIPFIPEEADYIVCDNRADVPHLAQVFLRCLLYLIKLKVRSQVAGSRLPHFPDTQGVQEFIKTGIFTGLNRLQQVFSRFIAHSLKGGNLFMVQVEQVGNIANQPFVK